MVDVGNPEQSEENGRWEMYLNGVSTASGVLKNARRKIIPARGSLVLGQSSKSDDTKLFNTDYAFVGDLSHVNIWNYVKTPTEVKQLSEDCKFTYCGNVVQWAHFREGTRGALKMRWPSGIFKDQCFEQNEAALTCDKHCSYVIGAQCNEEIRENVVWERTKADEVAMVPCPGRVFTDLEDNTYAKRACSKTEDNEGFWENPQIEDCISSKYFNIQKDIQRLLHSRRIKETMILELAKDLVNLTALDSIWNPIDISSIIHSMHFLVQAQESTLTDISWTEGLIKVARAEDFYPSFEQTRQFAQLLVRLCDEVLNERNEAGWRFIQPRGAEGDQLLNVMKHLLDLIAKSFMYHINLGDISHTEAFISKLHHNIAFKIKTYKTRNIEGVAFPDMIDIQTLGMEDRYGTIALPKDAILDLGVSSLPEFLVISTARYITMPMVLPNHLPKSKEDNLNSALFALFIHLKDDRIQNLSQPIQIRLPYLKTFNISNPECVYLAHGNGSRDWSWDHGDCSLYTSDWKYSQCTCRHPGLFAVTTDMYDVNWDKGEKPNTLMEIPSYVGCSVSAILCLTSLLMLVYLRTSSNTAAIHKNFSLSIVCSQLSFMFGIDRIHHVVVCQVFAISLHYFVLAAFSWLMNEAFNLYIVITYAAHSHGEHTESSMWRYYLLGWVIPGVLAGAFVGSHSHDYYAPDMCWIAWEHVWLFIGPVIGTIAITILVLIFTAKEHHESSYTKNEQANKVILIHSKALWTQVILLTIAWAFAFVSVRMRGSILKYLYAMFNCLQGAFFLVFYFLLNEEVRAVYKAHRKKRNLALQGYEYGEGEGEDDDSDEDERSESDRSMLVQQDQDGDIGNEVVRIVTGSTSSTPVSNRRKSSSSNGKNGGRNGGTNAKRRNKSQIEASSDENSDCEIMITSV
ncbi:adhesion G protein-coupled receptor L3-like [Tubulanus polymorphus]|uniref:adhesion G protein-coupled receptor L3-like n=1 Tax=Tubulanus polymorphus TaxID=672921 RepID=UPI003DA1DC9D